MITPKNFQELISQGQTDINEEISATALRSIALALGCDEGEVQVVAGPCETLRIKVPTYPKRRTPMGEKP